MAEKGWRRKGMGVVGAVVVVGRGGGGGGHKAVAELPADQPVILPPPAILSPDAKPYTR